MVAANGKSGAPVFIFATEDGTISGWNPTVDLHNATNFHDGVVEMYDASFQFVKSFTDSSVPLGYAPFGIRNINGELTLPSRYRMPRNMTTSAAQVTAHQYSAPMASGNHVSRHRAL